ncbi:MAG TPA: phytanoyl-CoA dioxygenase family protein [Allocoleopsis sp.]
MLSSIPQKIQNKVAKIPSEASYKVSLLKHAPKLPELSQFERRIVETCNKEGVFVTSLKELGLSSTSQLIEAAKSQLEVMKTLLPPERVDRSTMSSDAPSTYPQIFTVTDLPEFYSWGSEERLLNIAENFIGLPVGFQGVHLRRDFANNNPVTTEFWHQDLEDRRILKIFVYMSDVSRENGPFEYIPKYNISPILSWRINQKMAKANALGITDRDLETIVPRSAWKSCPGPAGTVIFADTKGTFHHGQSRQKERAALFFVYTAKEPLHPEYCTQYSDKTFARPDFSSMS